MKSDRPEQLPKARTEQLIVKEVDGEVLVYDQTTDRAHCLNSTAAKVWKKCDGDKSLSDIRASLADEVGAPVDEGVVWLALDQLKQFKLLAEVPSAPAVFAGMTRRQVMRNIGVAAVALPVVISIIAPNAVSAASCGQVCGSPADCPGNCPTCAKLTPTSPNKTCN